MRQCSGDRFTAAVAPMKTDTLTPGSRTDRLQGLSSTACRLVQETTAALQRRDAAVTMRHLSALHALAPAHPEVLRLRAAVAHLQGHIDEAIVLLREAAAVRPEDALVLSNLAHALADRGESDTAEHMLRRCIELEPERVAHGLSLARLYERRHDARSASDVLQAVLQREPGHAPAQLAFARMLHFLGDSNEAARQYRQVLARQPESAGAWHGLSTLHRHAFDPADTDAMERLHGHTGLTDQARTMLGFALARAYEEQDRYADAWRVLSEANASWRRRLAWDAAAISRHVRDIETAFPRDVPRSGPQERGAGLVFIVGMPRSGTSIVEQILASHPDVAAGGELDEVTTIIRTESERRERDFPGWVTDCDTDDWRRLGEDYLERTRQRRSGRNVFTDKNLMNWLYLGALRFMLPGARFVDCRRDPLETCLACYRQLFAKDLGFAYNLDEFVRFWNDYDHAMQHWVMRHSDSIIEMRLEQLTETPEAGIRRLLDFCQLPFDARCLDFHQVERSVYTLSADQVREPLRRNAPRASRYAHHLDALRTLFLQAGAQVAR
jgi:tetratricopeptide (TPR) repeat protein